MLTNRRIAVLISNLAAVTLGAIPFQIYQAQPVDPSNRKRLFAFSENLAWRPLRTEGKNWHPRNNGLRLSRQEFVFTFAFDRKNSNHLFAATPEKIFRSTDGRENWEKIL